MKSIFNKSAKNRTKNVIVSIVALILSVCMLTSVTYSWIDKISEISVVSPKPDGKTTLTIDSTTNSVINFQADNTETVIDLGSYFNMGGNMHLTSCSSNGKDFFFKSGGDENNSYFRRGSANDVNVNYISCTFKVESSIDDTVLWFNELPQLTMGETSLDDYLRCAVTVDDETTVFAKGGSYNCVNSTTVSGTAGYTECTAVGAGNYLFDVCENYLFFIDEGDSKIVNVKLWIEDPESTLDINSKELKLNLSFLTTLNRRTVTFKDCTFSEDGINQVSSGNYYACLGSSLEEGDYDLDTYWGFAPVAGDDNKYTVDIPIIYCNDSLLIMNCDDSYGSGDNQLNDETINYNYIWVAGTMGDQDTYNAFGALGDVKKSQKGFWGTAKKVFVDDQMGLDVSDTTMLMYENDNDNDKQNRSMYYNVVKGKWVGYIHSDSTQIRFQVSGTQNYWGYHSNTNNEIKGNNSDTYTIYDINNGTWKANTNLISPFSLVGTFNDWQGTPMLLSDASEHTYCAAVDLKQDEYEFKIIKASEDDQDWLGNTSASFSFGSDETKMSASETFIPISGDSGNVSLKITSLYGGTVLFIIDKDDNKVTLKYTPSTTASNEVRSYVMLSSSWDNGTTHWLESMKHNENDSKHGIRYVDDFSIGGYRQNCFTLNANEWDNAKGSWSFVKAGSNRELFFNPSSWDSDGATFVANFSGTDGYKKVNLNKQSDGKYSVAIPEGNYDKVQFLRMSSDGTKEWNYSSTFDLQFDNYFTLGSGWDNISGAWSYKKTSNRNIIYFKPNSNWTQSSAWFAAYFFNDSSNAWAKFTKDSSGDYYCTIPDGNWTGINFVRMNSAKSALDWDSKWNQTANVSVNLYSITYHRYYSNLTKNNAYLQWVDSNGVCRPDKDLDNKNSNDGYYVGTHKNGAMYYMAADNADYGCGTITTNIQNPPTISASTTGTVGTSITFNISAESTTGVAGKGKSYSYYVTNTATDTTWVTDSTWTPLFEGTYEVTARANDGYITTDVSNTVTIKVTND